MSHLDLDRSAVALDAAMEKEAAGNMGAAADLYTRSVELLPEGGDPGSRWLWLWRVATCGMLRALHALGEFEAVATILDDCEDLLNREGPDERALCRRLRRRWGPTIHQGQGRSSAPATWTPVLLRGGTVHKQAVAASQTGPADAPGKAASAAPFHTGETPMSSKKTTSRTPRATAKGRRAALVPTSDAPATLEDLAAALEVAPSAESEGRSRWARRRVSAIAATLRSTLGEVAETVARLEPAREVELETAGAAERLRPGDRIVPRNGNIVPTSAEDALREQLEFWHRALADSEALAIAETTRDRAATMAHPHAFRALLVERLADVAPGDLEEISRQVLGRPVVVPTAAEEEEEAPTRTGAEQLAELEEMVTTCVSRTDPSLRTMEMLESYIFALTRKANDPLSLEAAEQAIVAAAKDPRRALYLSAVAVRFAVAPVATALAWAARGNAYRVLEEWAAADSCFNRTIDKLPRGDDEGGATTVRALGLIAAWRTDRQEWEQAHAAIEEALDLDTGERRAALLVKRARALGEEGETAAAIEALQEAREHMPAAKDRARLDLVVPMSLARFLIDAGRLDEAEVELEAVAKVATEPLDLLRLSWATARILAGRGESGRALEALGYVSRGMLEAGHPQEAAQAGLEAALLHAKEGRTDEVRALCGGLVKIFRAGPLGREAMAAVSLLLAAVVAETMPPRLTVLLEEVTEFLRLAGCNRRASYTPPPEVPPGLKEEVRRVLRRQG